MHIYDAIKQNQFNILLYASFVELYTVATPIKIEITVLEILAF